MYLWHTDLIGMHYNEAALNEQHDNQHPMTTPAGALLHLRVCGLSKTEVLINKCTNIGRLRRGSEGETLVCSCVLSPHSSS